MRTFLRGLPMIRTPAKLIILVASLAASFFVGLLYLNHVDRTRLDLLFREREKERDAFLDTALQLDAKPPAAFAYDYSWWDEMVNLVNNPNQQWADDNIAPYLVNFETNYAWVYRTDFSLVYSTNNVGDSSLGASLLSTADLRSLFSKCLFCHFFVSSSRGPVEICTAPIHQNLDDRKLSPTPRGFFVVGRLWDKTLANKLSVLTESRVFIVAPQPASEPKQGYNPRDGTIHLRRQLLAWNGSTVATLNLVSESPIFVELQRASRNQALLFVGFALITIFFLSGMLMKWVGAPLKALFQGLDSGDMQSLQQLRMGRNEFGQLAQLVVDSFQQKVDLIREVEERKKAQAALQTAEATARDLFDNAPDVYCVIDPDGILSSINHRGAATLGWKPEELCGQPVDIIIHPEDREWVRNAIHDMCSSGTVAVGSELRKIRKDGSALWISEEFTLITDEKGGVKGIRTICRDITERKQAEEIIRSSLKEKELLLREIHHRVKNNMQVICSLLSLQSQFAGDHSASEFILELFRESQNRVKSMALIHEKLYQAGNLGSIDFAEYIRALTAGLIRTYGSRSNRVDLVLEADPVLLGIDTAIPCGLIINELVTNSLKYAFPADQTGEIKIGLRKQNTDQITLSVKDNGIGFPKDVNFKHTSSLGLQLVNTLTEQIRGSIELSERQGTEFLIRFSSGERKSP